MSARASINVPPKAISKSGSPPERWVKQLRALADTSRLRIIAALLTSSLSVNEIAARLKLSQYNVSKHLRVLREAEIVEMEPSANRRQYSIAEGFRSRVSRSNTLDLGCCTMRFDRLLPPYKKPASAR